MRKNNLKILVLLVVLILLIFISVSYFIKKSNNETLNLLIPETLIMIPEVNAPLIDGKLIREGEVYIVDQETIKKVFALLNTSGLKNGKSLNSDEDNIVLNMGTGYETSYEGNSGRVLRVNVFNNKKIQVDYYVKDITNPKTLIGNLSSYNFEKLMDIYKTYLKSEQWKQR